MNRAEVEAGAAQGKSLVINANGALEGITPGVVSLANVVGVPGVGATGTVNVDDAEVEAMDAGVTGFVWADGLSGWPIPPRPDTVVIGAACASLGGVVAGAQHAGEPAIVIVQVDLAQSKVSYSVYRKADWPGGSPFRAVDFLPFSADSAPLDVRLG